MARIKDVLARSPRLVRAKRAILPNENRAIIEGFPMFVPRSAGSINNLAPLTIEAAKQIFPLMLQLASLGGRAIEEPIPIGSFADSDGKKAAADRLKGHFDGFGSDKATNHDYHLIYGSILDEPDSATALLEIGIGTNHLDVVSNIGRDGRPGASLRAFREFLPRATIYGADVDRRVLFEEERIRTFFVDQTKPESFAVLAAATPNTFDLIIDDGLHSPNANVATLVFALGRLKVGGWFVVEDIVRAALPLWQLVSTLLADQYEPHLVAEKGGFLFSTRRLQ